MLQLQQRIVEERLDLLGQQIWLALDAFRESERIHHCHVRGEDVLGREVLTGAQERRFLMYESLPGSVAVKAIGVDRHSLFVELTPFDPEVIADLQEEDGLPQDVIVTERELRRGRKRLAYCVQASQEVAAEHGARCLWIIPWKKLKKDELSTAIATLDQLDATAAYMPEDVGAEDAAAPTGTVRLEQRMSIQLELIQAQVPVMALHEKLSVGIRGELKLSLELLQVLRFEQLLEKDPEGTVLRYLSEGASPERQAKLANLIRFKLVRDVRKAAEAAGSQIGWKEARKLVRTLTRP